MNALLIILSGLRGRNARQLNFLLLHFKLRQERYFGSNLSVSH